MLCGNLVGNRVQLRDAMTSDDARDLYDKLCLKLAQLYCREKVKGTHVFLYCIMSIFTNLNDLTKIRHAVP